MKTALVFACDDNFLPYTCVAARRAAMLSPEKFAIIIVSDGISDENKRLARKFCSRISFIEASQLFGTNTFRTTESYRRATYLRLYLDEIMADLDRIVYLDGDMTPLVDVSPLLQIVPTVSPVAATYGMNEVRRPVHNILPISKDAGYLQGGVQIFDLKAIRAEGIFKDAIKFANENPEKCQLVDQDALNAVLNGRWQVLDWRWNVMNEDSLYQPRPHFIRHHAGPNKPWALTKTNCEPFVIEHWRKDLAESPWPERYLPAKKGAFARKYIRPSARAIEVPLKALFRGDVDTLIHGEPDAQEMKRYLKNLPSLLAQIEGKQGQLASALPY